MWRWWKLRPVREIGYVQRARLLLAMSVGLSLLLGFILSNQRNWEPGLPMARIAQIAPASSSLQPGMYVAYDQTRMMGNNLAYAQGSHFVYSWKQLEGVNNSFDWGRVEDDLAALALGKKAIIRVVVRHENDGVEAFTPDWLLADRFHPIKLGTKKMLNYLDPAVKAEREELVRAMATRFKGDKRIAAVEIGPGYSGESNPEPGSNYVADKGAQLAAYQAAGYTGESWSRYHRWLMRVYAEAWRGSGKELLTLVNGSFAEEYRGELVAEAISLGVGLVGTDLHSDFFSNRGSAQGYCYWGDITKPGYMPNHNSRFQTSWAALQASSGLVPIGWEYNNRYDFTGYITDYEDFNWWAIANALDKRADYVLPFNDKDGQSGDVEFPEPWEFYERYVGRTASDTPEAWIVFRSSKPDLTVKGGGSWCPDIFDYSFYITSEMEKPGYYNSKLQTEAKVWDEDTRVFNQGSSDSWHHWYARKTTATHPVIRLDIDDTFARRADRFLVTVTYLDQGSGEWGLKYDSKIGEKLVGKVQKTGSNQWKEKVFELDDARFNNGLEGYDLALWGSSSGEADVFGMVKVKPLSGLSSVGTPTPTPTIERKELSGAGCRVGTNDNLAVGVVSADDGYDAAGHNYWVRYEVTRTSLAVKSVSLNLAKFYCQDTGKSGECAAGKQTQHLRFNFDDPSLERKDADTFYFKVAEMRGQTSCGSFQIDANPEKINGMRCDRVGDQVAYGVCNARNVSQRCDGLPVGWRVSCGDQRPATPTPTVEPTKPTATPTPTVELTKPTATPAPTVELTKPTATPTVELAATSRSEVAARGAGTPLQAATMRISALSRLMELLKRFAELISGVSGER